MLIVLCGIPGSGKTTLAKQLAEQNNAKLYCFDELPNSHHIELHESVRNQMWQDIADDLRNNCTIICDDLHTKLKWRNGILSAVSDVSCKKILVVIDTPLDECLCRNKNREFRLPNFVVTNIYEHYERPSIYEGWDEIVYDITNVALKSLCWE